MPYHCISNSSYVNHCISCLVYLLPQLETTNITSHSVWPGEMLRMPQVHRFDLTLAGFRWRGNCQADNVAVGRTRLTGH